jgi:hypothetical protein
MQQLIFSILYTERKEKFLAGTAERKLQTGVIFAIMNDRIRWKRGLTDDI